MVFLFSVVGSTAAQTPSEKAQKQITEQKEKARVAEAKDLLEEKERLQSRITEIDKRLKDLDGGAEPKSYLTFSISGGSGNVFTIQPCCCPTTYYYWPPSSSNWSFNSSSSVLVPSTGTSAIVESH